MKKKKYYSWKKRKYLFWMEYRIRRVNFHKKRLNQLIQKGESLSSNKIVSQERKVDKHSLLLEQLRKSFEELYGESIKYYNKDFH